MFKAKGGQAMTDEEKEAIEYWRGQIELYSKEGRQHKTLQALLDLIEKQNNIIKGNECVIETMSRNEKVLLEAIEKKDKIINRMAKKIGEIMTDIEVIKRQFEEKYCEFITSDDDCCMKVDKDCSDCIKEYFEKEEG